ncbi:hypothetical protein J27TS8_30020 [Robertmurraya siralis]|uniref:Uncharacterized protein n=1 Tax=Robertmurraya siralis TaxID=77777 RepID=A0A919WJP7_9BACI|nr:hypothetical protein J27TS8_30020 [Robertmurraya siralis]
MAKFTREDKLPFNYYGLEKTVRNTRIRYPSIKENGVSIHEKGTQSTT